MKLSIFLLLKKSQWDLFKSHNWNLFEKSTADLYHSSPIKLAKYDWSQRSRHPYGWRIQLEANRLAEERVLVKARIKESNKEEDKARLEAIEVRLEELLEERQAIRELEKEELEEIKRNVARRRKLEKEALEKEALEKEVLEKNIPEVLEKNIPEVLEKNIPEVLEKNIPEVSKNDIDMEIEKGIEKSINKLIEKDIKEDLKKGWNMGIEKNIPEVFKKEEEEKPFFDLEKYFKNEEEKHDFVREKIRDFRKGKNVFDFKTLINKGPVKGEEFKKAEELKNSDKALAELVENRKGLILFVKFITFIIWVYLVYKFAGDVWWLWDYYNPPNLPLPPVPKEPEWSEQFLTNEKLKQMEYIITKNEDFGPIVLKEKTRLILESNFHFLKDLETQLGLSGEDRKKILAVMDDEEQKELFYLVDLVKELWVAGFENERGIFLARIIALLAQIKDRADGIKK